MAKMMTVMMTMVLPKYSKAYKTRQMNSMTMNYVSKFKYNKAYSFYYRLQLQHYQPLCDV